MICPDCHGNGYWIVEEPDAKTGAMRQVRQCETCNSQGEIEESKDAKTNED